MPPWPALAPMARKGEEDKTKLSGTSFLTSIKSNPETGSFSELAINLQETLHFLENIDVNVGITGEQGAGKSTLINSIRDLCEEEAGAAPTGGTNTNKDPTAYPHPKYANVVLWDLPSIGTPDFQPKVYLEQIRVSSYDFFIILAAQHFTSCHTDLAQGLKEVGKDFYFVRSKVDVDLASAHQSQPSGFSEGAALQKIRKSCVQDLQAAGVESPKVFLISNILSSKYDFPLLEENLGKGLYPNKSHAFLLATPNTSHRILETKKSSIIEHMWLVSVVASGINAVPVAGFSISCDWDFLVKTLQGCCISFGLEDSSLRKVAEHIAQPFEELTALVKSPLAADISQALVVQLMEQAARKAPHIPKELLSCTAIKESMAEVGLSFPVVYQMLKSFVDEVAADAHRILVKVFMSQGPRSEPEAGISGTSSSIQEEKQRPT